MEKPILFKSDMVKAILDGRKTMTRRAVKNKEFLKWVDAGFDDEFIKNPSNRWIDYCSYGKVGDVLWVKETFQWDWKEYPERKEKFFFYKADTDDSFLASGEKWKSSLFMPKEAARIWLEITDIKVERLQDISEEDAKAEGIGIYEGAFKFFNPLLHNTFFSKASLAFQSLWESINGEESWNLNPFVWVISFKVLSTTGKPKFKKLENIESW